MADANNWFSAVPQTRRRIFPAAKRQGKWIRHQGAQLLNFASNDYLGLACHPQIRKAASGIIEAHGFGSGASRLISGDDPLLHRLERRMAEWKGFEDCLLAGSGMLANMGLIQALVGHHDQCFCDRLNHASLVDGVRLSGAKLRRFPHRDYETLQQMLKRHPGNRRLIVSDGVFSMDGDCADLTMLLHLAETHDALLLIDDAHGTGTLADGRGLSGMAGVGGHPRLVEVGTFGKAFGGYGAFILGSRPMIEGLRQRLRTVIYSTALPLAVIAAMDAALSLIQKGDLVQQLSARIATFRRLASGLPIMDSLTPIQPLMIGGDTEALEAADRLRQAGFFVPAIRPPTVPEGSARLRITLSAVHENEDIERLVEALVSL